MSKKLAEGLKALVLDVKWGSGAFMKTLEDANELAAGLIAIGEAQGVKTSRSPHSNEAAPWGLCVGNALEVNECIEIFKARARVSPDGDMYQDTRELSLALAGRNDFRRKAANIAGRPEIATEHSRFRARPGRAFKNGRVPRRKSGGFCGRPPFAAPVPASQSGYV